MGANLVIHATKKTKQLDPYFLLGLKWIGAHGYDSDENGGGGLFPFPLLNGGFGLRYDITPHVGVYAETSATTFIFLGWELEGNLGVSFGF